jgi:transposase
VRLPPRRHTLTVAEPGQVKIGIETDRGPWVQALTAAGYEVFAINPLQVARYRERHSVSGGKSDATTTTPNSSPRSACTTDHG